jgi:hypothetical protein
MDIILDNIVLILFVIGGAIAQWIKARAEAGQNQDTGYEPTDFEEMMEEEERRRSRPAVPPPLSPAASLPSVTRRNVREPEPSAYDVSSELARQQQIAEKLKEAKRTRGAREISESLNPKQHATSDRLSASGSSLKSRLGNRRELREVLVLKEILEKPVGLR